MAHDLPVDLVATPRAVIDVERQYPRPRGILWDHLQPPQIREIPILEGWGMPETIASGSVVFPASDYGNPDPEWLKIDWRKHLHRVELPGAEVNYAEIGEGEPIIFLHGLGGCWRNWLETLPHFGRTHRAIAIDLPGFGESPMPSWSIDMPAYGRLVHDFCQRAGIGRA